MISPVSSPPRVPALAAAWVRCTVLFRHQCLCIKKQLYLGVYESEVDAAKAHDRAARFHFAESAVCNFDNEHEADRQAAIHKERQLVQQQQLAEDRAHHAQLHGGSFSVGREEFDDLEEYHRGMDEATCSSEDGEGMDEPLHGDEHDDEEEEDQDGREHDNLEGDMSEEGDDGSEEEEDGPGRLSRSMSYSYSSAMSTGSMSDGDGGSGGHSSSGHHRSRSAGNSPHCEVTAPAAAVAAAAAAFAPAVVPLTAAVAGGSGAGSGNSDLQVQQQQRGRCSSGESDCSSDFVRPSALMREESQSSSQEGMGFPVAEDLLGYEMQSWYCCQDDEERSPASPGAAPFESQLKQQQPFMGRQQQSEELWGSAVGANLGWGFGDFAQTYSDGGSRASSGSMSSSNLSCDDEYVPSALPPLMGMSAAEA